MEFIEQLKKTKFFTCLQGKDHERIGHLCIDQKCPNQKLLEPLCIVCEEEHVHNQQGIHQVLPIKVCLEDIFKLVNNSQYDQIQPIGDNYEQEIYSYIQQYQQMSQNCQNIANLLGDYLAKYKEFQQGYRQNVINILQNLINSQNYENFTQEINKLKPYLNIVNGQFALKKQQQNQFNEYNNHCQNMMKIAKSSSEKLSVEIIQLQKQFQLFNQQLNQIKDYSLKDVMLISQFQLNNFQSKQEYAMNTKIGIFNLLSLTDTEFASLGTSSEIAIWELGKTTPNKVFNHESCGSGLWALEKIDETTIAAGGSGDFSIKFFNWKTGDCTQTFKSHTSNIRTIVNLQEQQMIASTGEDRAMIIWKYNGQIVKNIQNTHSSYVYSCITVNNDKLLSTGGDNKIKMWNTNNWQIIKEVNVEGGKYSYSLLQLNYELIAVAGYDDGKIRIYNIDNLEFKYSIQAQNQGESIFKLVRLDDETIIASGHVNKIVKIINWKQQKCYEDKKIQTNGQIYCGLIIQGQKIITGSAKSNQIIVFK